MSTTWAFRRRIRRGAFGWKNTTARKALKEAIKEIRAAARSDAEHAAEGAVQLVERLAPAFENVDDSSGALQGDIAAALDLLTRCLEKADVETTQREAWLERLWQAYLADTMPWIEAVGDRWGTLCVEPGVASRWADRLASETDQPGAERTRRDSGHFDPTRIPWLSALYAAGRFTEIVDAAPAEPDLWHYDRWVVAACRALGRRAEALRRARDTHPAFRPPEVDQVCEEILLESGLDEEAWERHAVAAAASGSRATWLRTLARRYPDRDPHEILERLTATTPGQEGRWFAAARQVGLLDAALDLARRSPAEPATLITAVKRHADSDPEFACECGLLAAHGLVQGDAFEPEHTSTPAPWASTWRVRPGSPTPRRIRKPLSRSS